MAQEIKAAATELELIAEAIRNPEKFDKDKFDTIMRWRERERDLALLGAFNNALHAAQAKMIPVAADLVNPQTQSKYASYFTLDKAIRPHYIEAGLSISYDTGVSPLENHVRTLAYVSHGAYTKQFHCDMPIVTTGVKGSTMMTLTHATASAHTYGKRYLLADIFNLAIDRDDDGNAAGNQPITDDQVKGLEKLIAEIGGKKAAALQKGWAKYFKIKNIGELPAVRYDAAVAALEAKRGKV